MCTNPWDIMVSRVGLLQEEPSKKKAKLNSQAVAEEIIFILLESRMQWKSQYKEMGCRHLTRIPLYRLAEDWAALGFSSTLSGRFSVATRSFRSSRRELMLNLLPILYIFIILPVEYYSDFIKWCHFLVYLKSRKRYWNAGNMRVVVPLKWMKALKCKTFGVYIQCT